jgi:membrane-bound metal-dependent hydrolase YbcI (DUF457 family)
MHPTTHLLLGWAVANSANLERRDRAVVTLAGVLPDADALGVLAGKDWFSEYHHVITHNIGVALLAGLAVLVFSRRRFTAAALALLSFHLHLVGDLLGSRGPDGYQWPIPYLLPFSDAWQLAWDGQWALNAWPNVAITIALLGLTLYWAWKRGFSPMEIVSRTLDQAVVVALRRRFGTP